MSTISPKRNLSIDVARLIAAYGVIVLHVPSGNAEANVLNLIFWPICVPFFYVVSLTYFVQGISHSGSNYYDRNWQRIVVPYIVWTCIYSILMLVKLRITGNGSEIIWWRAFFYGEVAVHLYFVPTLLFMQALVMGIYLLLKKDSKERVIAAFALVISAAYFIIGVYYNCYGIRTVGSLLGVAMFSLVAFWMAPRINREMSGMTRTLLSLGGLLLMSVAILCKFKDWLMVVDGYPLIFPLGGIGLFMLVAANPVHKLPLRVFQLTALSYGIYLSHIVFLEAYELIVNEVFKIRVVNGLGVKLFEVTLIFIAAASFIMIVKKIPLLRRLMVGEK